MAPAQWSQIYQVYSFLVSRQGRLSLYGLLNLLQDIALEHAQAIGFGWRESLERKTFWVLTRQKVVMREWPRWNDEIKIETWIRPTDGAFVVRDFFLFDAQGVLIGEATTSWLRLHADTHKPMREPLTDFPAGSGRCSFDAEKVAIRHAGLTTLGRFEVRNSDIDGNQHVNNTRYSQWILDAIPIAAHGQHVLDEYNVNFLSETRLGDTIEVQASIDDGYYQGLRVSDKKIVFSAFLKTRPRP